MAEELTGFDESTARRVLAATLAHERGLQKTRHYRRRIPQDDEEDLRWGLVLDNWTAASSLANILFANPCDSEGDNAVTGTVVCLYIHTPRKDDPTAAIPEAVPVVAADVVAYLPLDVGDYDSVVRGSTAVDEYGLLVDTETMRGTWDSPDAIDPSTITGSVTTAQSDTWDRTSQGASDGLTIKLTTRVAYDDTASPPVLYGFFRTFTYDSTGRLVTISAETRYTIDDPAACP